MKKAFTLVELIFVVVVLGILAFALWPTKQPTQALEAARQIVAHMRYTQHLALNDDKFGTHIDTDANNKNVATEWYKRMWRIAFSNPKEIEGKCTDTGWRYAVYQNIAKNLSDKGQPNGAIEVAQNPAEPGKILSGCFSGTSENTTSSMNLNNTYGIDNIDFDEFGTQGIIFDELGRAYPRGDWTRPYSDANKFKLDNGNYGRIKLSSKDGSKANILIFKETGYACVENVDSGCTAPANNS